MTTRRALVGIVVAAAGIRLLHFAAIADTAFPQFPLVFTESDMHAFWGWAQSIVAGDWMGRDTYHPSFAWMRDMAPVETWHRWWGGKETFHQAPLYPYAIAAVLLATGASAPGPVLLVQLVLGALQPLVLFALGRRVAGERAGLVAAGIAALYGPFVFHQGVLLRDWLPPILEPLALVLLLRAAERRRPRDWILAGAAVGVALLTRETALLLVPAVAVWLLFVRWGQWRAIAVAAVLLLLGFGLALTPLVARNAVVGAPLLALSNRGGVTFVQHNAAASSPLWSELDPSLQKQILDEADRDGRSAVLATIATHGGDRWAVLRKVGMKLRGAVDPIEIPSNVSFSYGRELSWVLRVLPTYGLIFPLGAVGLALSFRNWRRHVLLHLYFGITVATLLISLPLARYRLPLATVLILYAGLAVSHAIDAVRARHGASLAAGLLAVAIAAFLQQVVLAVPELRTSGWMAMYGAGVEHRTAAGIHLADGRPDRAADELMRLRARANADPWSIAIARSAGCMEAGVRADWAARLIGRNEMQEARAQLAEAERLDAANRTPEERPPPDLLYQLGSLYDQLGDAPKARDFLLQYLAAEPAGPGADAARRLLMSR